MADGTPDGSALGLPVTDVPEGDVDPLADEAPSTPAEAPSETPQRPWQKEEGAEAPEPEPEPALDESARYGEKAYKQLQSAWTRDRQALQELEQRTSQHEQLFEALAPLLRQQLSDADPNFAQQIEQQAQLQPMLDQAMAPYKEAFEQQQQQMEAERLVGEFRAKHPDVAPGTQEDQALASTASELKLRVQNPDSLEIAYEAWKNPALKYVLKANPVLIDTDEGIAYARLQAQQLVGSPAQGTPNQPTQHPASARAFVETQPGTPARAAPGTAAHDEFDEAFDSWAKERQSPLMGTLFKG